MLLSLSVFKIIFKTVGKREEELPLNDTISSPQIIMATIFPLPF